MPITRSCAILMVDPRRVRRWIAGRDPKALMEAELTDTPPIAKGRPHAIRTNSRERIEAEGEGPGATSTCAMRP